MSRVMLAALVFFLIPLISATDSCQIVHSNCDLCFGTCQLSSCKIMSEQPWPLTPAILATPKLEVQTSIYAHEGDVISLEPSCKYGVLQMSGWMTTPKKTSSYKDAGTHTVDISCSNLFGAEQQQVTIHISDYNRPPVIEAIHHVRA